MKTAQEQRQAPKRKPPHMSAYPDYTKSLAHQRYRAPTVAGVERGIQSGVTGAVLGALIARVVSNRLSTVAAGAGIGAIAGMVPGFVSGKHQAESDYSKLLFMRRRMGVNEPGELDAVLQHPELANDLVRKQASVNPVLLKVLAGMLVGGGAGAGWGYKVSPELSGYSDVVPARRLSGVAGTATGALLGGLAMGKPGTMAKFLTNPRTAMLVPSGIVGGEVLPSMIAMFNRQSKATGDLAKATHDSSIPVALKQLAGSGAGKGMAAGAGLAGLAGLGTGLLRARTDAEIKQDKSRIGMVGSDILKYLLPALIGGGVVGSLQRPA